MDNAQSDLPVERQKNISNEIKKSTELLEDAISNGLSRLCKLYDRDPNPVWFDIWCEHLGDMPAAGIAWAFGQLEKTFIPTLACPFPVPAHVRNLLEKPAQLEREQEAELAWQTACKLIHKHYHPDLGWRGERPSLPAAVEAAGGVNYLWRASATQLVWAKKAFLEAYLREEQLRQYAVNFSKEVKGLLAENTAHGQ